MPFVEIEVPAGRPPTYRRAVADAVHQALVETVDVPLADRFQVIRTHAAEDVIYDPSYLGIERSPDFLAVRVTLRRGRSPEKKRALYRAIADKVHAATGTPIADVFIVLSENELIDWSFGNGIAQYAQAESAKHGA